MAGQEKAWVESTLNIGFSVVLSYACSFATKLYSFFLKACEKSSVSTLKLPGTMLSFCFSVGAVIQHCDS